MGKLRDRMIQDLQLAGKSDGTVTTYAQVGSQLAKHFMQCPTTLTEDQVRG